MKSQVIFDESEARFFSLRRQLERKQISAAQYAVAVGQLRFQEVQGTWWQIHPETGAWLRWDGLSWEAAIPPNRRGPQTLADLTLSLGKEIFKGILWKLPSAIGFSLLILAIHTALMVILNHEVSSGENALLDMFLSKPGSLASGTLFWGALAGLTAHFTRWMFRQGAGQTVQKILTTPAWVEYSLSGSAGNVLILLLVGCALGLLGGVILGNRLVSFLMVLGCSGALVAQTDSFSLRITRLAWSDGLRLLNRPARPFNPAWGGLGITGAVFGFMAAVILPLLPYSGCVGVLFIMGLLIILSLIKKETAHKGIYFFLWMSVFWLAGISPAQAGADAAMKLWEMAAYGILPAAGAFFGAWAGFTTGGYEPEAPPTGRAHAAAPPSGGAGAPPALVSQPAAAKPLVNVPFQPIPAIPGDKQILKGQAAFDILVRLRMVKRVITPQGGRYLPLNLDPREPVSAIAYFLDEQGFLQPAIAILYSPPAAAPKHFEPNLPPKGPGLEPGQESADGAPSKLNSGQPLNGESGDPPGNEAGAAGENEPRVEGNSTR